MLRYLATLIVILALANGAHGAAPTLKITTALEPIARNANGTERATRVQAFDLEANSQPLSSVAVTLSNPGLVKRLEARVGTEVVGSFDADGAGQTQKNLVAITIAEPSALTDGGELAIWAVPSNAATLDDKLELGIESVVYGDERVTIAAKPVEYRFGTLVRDSGWDGVAKYRIPGIVRSNKGTLIAVYDARWNGFPDLPADIDVMCSRSFDGGETWEPMQVVMDFKGDDETKEGVGDPCALVDPETGRIWVAALWAHNGRSTAASEPGLLFGKSGRYVICYSDDDGATWSEPRDITNEAAPNAEWRLFFQGPGNGIATRDGKLIFPSQFIDKDKVWYSTILWSDDKGATWHCGTGAHKMTCECQLVELNDGALMLNMRNFDGRPRSVAITYDLGKTWTEHSSSGKMLVEPVCQASLIKVKSTQDGDDANLLAFMNPNSDRNRVDMTIKLSEDEGVTWNRQITLYRPGGCGYSCLVKIDEHTLGALYETFGGLMFQRVKIAEIGNK